MAEFRHMEHGEDVSGFLHDPLGVGHVLSWLNLVDAEAECLCHALPDLTTFFSKDRQKLTFDTFGRRRWADEFFRHVNGSTGSSGL